MRLITLIIHLHISSLPCYSRMRHSHLEVQVHLRLQSRCRSYFFPSFVHAPRREFSHPSLNLICFLHIYILGTRTRSLPPSLAVSPPSLCPSLVCIFPDIGFNVFFLCMPLKKFITFHFYRSLSSYFALEYRVCPLSLRIFPLISFLSCTGLNRLVNVPNPPLVSIIFL